MDLGTDIIKFPEFLADKETVKFEYKYLGTMTNLNRKKYKKKLL